MGLLDERQLVGRHGGQGGNDDGLAGLFRLRAQTRRDALIGLVFAGFLAGALVDGQFVFVPLTVRVVLPRGVAFDHQPLGIGAGAALRNRSAGRAKRGQGGLAELDRFAPIFPAQFFRFPLGARPIARAAGGGARRSLGGALGLAPALRKIAHRQGDVRLLHKRQLVLVHRAQLDAANAALARFSLG